MKKADKAIDPRSVTHVSMSYAESVTPPTKADYRETRQILNDFCILVSAADIPKFPRMGDLIRWRTAYIQAALA
ncbi:MAG: hypothetical protein GX918_04810 [Clostridiales bacterium]|mgnify:CR=1 FL=1|jgi:hypothetical protein|nr:hypothetical protein [Clostridiales bacterium]